MSSKSVNIDETDLDYVIKIILIGDSCVGKTNILSQYIKEEFNENSKSTVGVEYAMKIITQLDLKLRLQIWDTAGQERFRAVTTSFYKNSSGALVVFDITKESSFRQVDNWIQELKEAAGNEVCIILVGNKIDLQNKREVSQEQAYEKANKYSNNHIKILDIDYVETSALNNSNITHAFTLLSNSKTIFYKRNSN